MAVRIQIAGARVIGIGATPACRIANFVVTIAVETVPIVFCRSGVNAIFRIRRAANGNLLALFHCGAALRSCDLGFTFTDNHIRLGIRVHLYPITSIAQRTHRDIRSINFNVRLTTLEDAVAGITLGDLQLYACAGQVCNLGLAARGQPQDVGIIQLNFRVRFLPRGHLVATNQWGVQGGC